LYLALELKLS